MEEEKLMQLISVQELLDDEDEEAFNVCFEIKVKMYNTVNVKSMEFISVYSRLFSKISNIHAYSI